MRKAEYTLVPTHLDGITIDTYQTFTGESYIECEIEYLAGEYGEDFEATDPSWNIEYDHTAIVEELAKTNLHYFVHYVNEFADAELLSDASVKEAFSPREYNFTTDGYEATMTIDLDVLEALTPEFDLKEYVDENWGSRSGFISFIPGRCERADWDPESEIGIQMRLDYLMREVVDHTDVQEAIMDAMFEDDWEIYSGNIKFTGATQEFLELKEAEAEAKRQFEAVHTPLF